MFTISLLRSFNNFCFPQHCETQSTAAQLHISASGRKQRKWHDVTSDFPLFHRSPVRPAVLDIAGYRGCRDSTTKPMEQRVCLKTHQLINKFPTFCGTQQLNTICTRSRHLSSPSGTLCEYSIHHSTQRTQVPF